MAYRSKKNSNKSTRPMSPVPGSNHHFYDDKLGIRRKASTLVLTPSLYAVHVSDDLVWEKTADSIDELEQNSFNSKKLARKFSDEIVYDCLVAKQSNVFPTLSTSRKNITTIPQNVRKTDVVPKMEESYKKTEKSHLKMLKLRDLKTSIKVRSQSINCINEPFQKVYLFGGCDFNEECYTSLICYEPSAHKLLRLNTRGPKPLNGIRGHRSVTINKRLYLIGGMDKNKYYNDLFILDTESLLWYHPRVLGDHLKPRRGHTICYYNGTIYLFGGGDGEEVFNDLFELKFESNTLFKWNQINYSGRVKNMGYHSATLYKNYWIIYGGTNGQECFGDIHILNLDTYEWKNITCDLNMQRMCHSATLFENKIYIVGGRTSTAYTNSTICIDIESGYKISLLKYDNESSVFEPRGYHSCFLRGSRLYIMNGYCDSKCYDDIHVLELNNKICGT